MIQLICGDCGSMGQWAWQSAIGGFWCVWCGSIDLGQCKNDSYNWFCVSYLRFPAQIFSLPSDEPAAFFLKLWAQMFFFLNLRTDYAEDNKRKADLLSPAIKNTSWNFHVITACSLRFRRISSSLIWQVRQITSVNTQKNGSGMRLYQACLRQCVEVTDKTQPIASSFLKQPFLKRLIESTLKLLISEEKKGKKKHSKNLMENSNSSLLSCLSEFDRQISHFIFLSVINKPVFFKPSIT